MKTIYTDKFGLYPLVLIVLSFTMFWSAYDTFLEGRHSPFGLNNTVGSLILVLGGAFWLVLAAKRFRDVRLARREGRDPTIIRVKQSDR